MHNYVVFLSYFFSALHTWRGSKSPMCSLHRNSLATHAAHSLENGSLLLPVLYLALVRASQHLLGALVAVCIFVQAHRRVSEIARDMKRTETDVRAEPS